MNFISTRGKPDISSFPTDIADHGSRRSAAAKNPVDVAPLHSTYVFTTHSLFAVSNQLCNPDSSPRQTDCPGLRNIVGCDLKNLCGCGGSTITTFCARSSLVPVHNSAICRSQRNLLHASATAQTEVVTRAGWRGVKTVRGGRVLLTASFVVVVRACP